MESDKAWLLLCKPCSVRVQKLPDSVINKWRKRTSLHHRSYPSRKRAADTEIHNCRLLRPRRKLMYSQDAINCIPYLFDDDDFDDVDNVNDIQNDQQLPELDISQTLPKIDEDDSVISAWKYKRKPRKLSDSSYEDVVDVVNHPSSIHEVLKDLKTNEEDTAIPNNRFQKEAKLILWRLENMNSDDPYFQAWKSKNNLQTNHSLFSLESEAPEQNEEIQSILQQNNENKDTPLQIEANENEPEKIDKIDDVPQQKNHSTPKHVKQNKNIGKTKIKRKMLPKSTQLNCSMCSIEFQTKEELSDHIFSHTSTDLKKTYAEAITESNNQNKDDHHSNQVEQLHEIENIHIGGNDKTVLDKSPVVTEKTDESMVIKATPDVNVNIMLNNSQLTVCSCHSEKQSLNEYSVQIEMVLYCENCHILFRRSECFEVHYRYSSKCNQERGKGRLPKLFCSTCRVVLNTLSDMRKHLEEHATINFHGTVTFVCNICRVVFFGVGTVFCTHWFTHEKDPTFVASRYSFPKLCVSNQGIKPAGAKPLEEYLFVAEYVCRICKLQFSSESELAKHTESACTKVQENAVNQMKSPEKPQIPSSKVKEPEVSQQKPSDLTENNVQIFELISKWECGFCNQTFVTWIEFEEHSIDHLQVIGYPGYLCKYKQNSPPSYICNICRRLCNNLPDLMKHWTSHNIIKFSCTFCKEKYSTLKSFISHVRRSCWKFKPGCTIILNNERHCCTVCKTFFESFEEMIQHDHNEHKTDNSPKKKTEEAKKSPRKQAQHIISENQPTLTEIVTLNLADTPTFNLHVKRPTVTLDRNKKSIPDLQSLNLSNNAGKTINSNNLDQRGNLSNNQTSHPASSKTSFSKNTQTVNTIEGPVQPVQLVSLIDKSGNLIKQVILNNPGVRITTSNNLTYQAVPFTDNIQISNNSKEIITSNNIGINRPVTFVLPKNASPMNTYKTVNKVKNIDFNNKNTPIVEQPRLITPTDNIENKKVQETISGTRSQENILNNPEIIKCSNTVTQFSNKVTEVNDILPNTKHPSDPIIVDSSSSDQDSEILVEKVCRSPEKRQDVGISTTTTDTSKKVDDEVKIINTSPNKTNTKPRSFLRVKNFKELLAVKNYICKQCSAAFDNETSLNEHLFAHMNSLNRKVSTPTMRAALVLPPTETNISGSSTQYTTFNVSNVSGKRILPVIPQRSQGTNSRIAIPLINRNSNNDHAQTIPTGISCPLCSYRCYKEDELRQHLLLHCQETMNNTQNVPSIMNNQNRPQVISYINDSNVRGFVPIPTATTTSADVLTEKSKIYNCKICLYTTTEKRQIIAHAGAHCIRQPQANTNVSSHNEPSQPTTTYSNVNTITTTPLHPVYSCSTCINYQTTSCEELNKHIRDTHLPFQNVNNYLSCVKCRLYFDSEESLRNHVKSIHMNFCKMCLRRFEDFNSFKTHLCCSQKTSG